MLSTIVLYSFVYLLLLSASLFLFIFLRRVVIQARERRDRAAYEVMERDLLEMLTSPAPAAAARDFAQKHRARPRVLKQVLVAYREALVGDCLEPLKTVFDRSIRRRCLRELKSPFLSTRLQNVRLFVDFSRPEEALNLVKLLHDTPIVRLAAEDPERADALVFGRVANPDRRGFLRGAGLAAMAAAVGAPIVFQENYPAGLIPSALADTTDPLVLPGKDGLVVLGDRPLNAETPAHLLDDDVTPNSRHFVRDNGLRPAMAENMDATGWTLTVDGEVDKPLTLTLDDLKRNFKPVRLKLQLECGGNGRASFNPPAKGNQFTNR